MRKTAVLVAAASLMATSLLAQQQQIRMPRPSPKSTVTQTVGVTDVTVNYSRPGVKGRQIWGSLVPYDKVWRAGANEATTVTFSDDVTIEGQKLAKGTYSLHAIPGKDEWTVIFNSVADQWGSYSYDATKDAARVKVKPEKAAFTEWMTIDFPNVTADEGTMAIRWENVSVPVRINTDSTNKTLALARTSLATAKADDWRMPYMAANFAFENNVATDEAGKWLDQSLKANENIANLYLKARMQAKAGDKAGAIKSAEAAIAKATPQQKDFASEIQKTIDGWKK
jgi:hypothetical protein